jgi:predicted Zn-ribbon and HTH transcriptional regulator
MKVLQQRGLLDTMTPSQLKNFQKTWYGAKDFEKGKSETLSTKALEDYNLGKRIEHKEAKSGDIAQIWRNNGSGHSVIFKDWVTDDKGNRIGIKYRSSQANTKGVGDRTEMFDNNIDPDRIYVARLNNRSQGGNVTTGHFQRGGATSPEAWGQEIKDIEGQIGNPANWTMDDYYLLQDKLNAYKDWRENTPEGQAVNDSHNEEGEYNIPLPEHLQDYTNGMMKSKLAYANEFGNPAAKRMINLPDNPYQFDSGDTGTHYMASMDNYAVPQIQDENGELMLGDYGPDSKEAIRFDSDEDARYFAEHYKDVSPGFVNAELTQNQIQEYAKGGYIIEDISVPELTQAQKGITISDPKEYAFRKAAYDDSLSLYNGGLNQWKFAAPLSNKSNSARKYTEWAYKNKNLLDKFYQAQERLNARPIRKGDFWTDSDTISNKDPIRKLGPVYSYLSLTQYKKPVQPVYKSEREPEREPLPEWKKLPIKHTEAPALEIIPQTFNYTPKKQEAIEVANRSQTVMEADPDRPGKYKVKEIRLVPYSAKFPGEAKWEPANAPRIIYTDDEGNETEERPGVQLNTLNLQGETFKQGGALLTKKVTCKKCGWEWDAADGGNDLTTCHKCGGQGLVHAQFGWPGKYIPKLPPITVPSVLKSTYKINPLALKSVPFGIENYFQNGKQLQPHWLRGFPKVANKVTSNEFNDIASQIGYGKNYPSGPATDMERKKLYDILSKTRSKNSLVTNSLYIPEKFPLNNLKRYSSNIPKTEVGSIKSYELFPNTMYAKPSRRNNFNYETYGGYDKNWKEKAFFAGLLGTTLGLGSAVGVGILADDPTKNSINRKIGYPLYLTNLMSDPNVTQKDTLINLNDNQLGYGQMKDSPEARILLGGDFVGDEENTVRPAKDWLHAKYGDTYGDNDFKTKDIKSFYGVENGTLKLGSAKDFKSNTKIVPNRYDDGRYINKAKIADGQLRLVGNDGQPIYHNTTNSGGKIIFHSKDNNKSIFISYSPENVNKTVNQINNFIKDNKNVKPIVIDNGRYIQWMQNNEGITDQNYSNFYSNDIQRGSNSGYNITIKKDGGSMDYQLGDEIDEATMEKLKKLGYTFEMVK